MFTEFFIRRPAFTIVITLILVILGWVSYIGLPLRWVPNITPPIVSIYSEYLGASAQLVETQITTPIESALSGLDGVETISSQSKEDASFVTLVFKSNRNIDSAVEDVRSALQRVIPNLPKDAGTPEVEKADPSTNPILYIAFSDSKRTEQQVSDYLKQFVTPSLESVDGVATISTYGEKVSAMRIWLDPMKMAASNVAVDDIHRVLTEQNVQVPSGKIRGDTRHYSVVMNETLNSADEFNNLIVRDEQNKIIRLKDIATAEVAAENPDAIFRVNGKPAVALAIIPQSNANPLDVAKAVDKTFLQIQKELPQGMEGKIVFSQATFIQASIDHVYRSLVEAILLVLIVIYLFLGNFRAALIPIITIPVCLIATFFLMHLANTSINTLTLMAFVLAIGLVVDDAIVMLENISRHIEAGMQPFAAAIKGSKEMIFPIIAMTVTLAAVYLPIAFTSGMLSAVFWEFSITLASAVLISGFVALTLSPMMSARLLNSHDADSSYQQKLTAFMHNIQHRYQHILDHVFSNKKRIVLSLLGIALLGGIFFHYMPKELAPTEDMDEVDIYASAPRDSSVEYTDHYTEQLESVFKTIPSVQIIASEIGFWSPSKSAQFIILSPKKDRKQSADDIAKLMEEKSKTISGIEVYVSPAVSPLTWYSDNSGASITLKLMSSMPFKELHATADRLTEVLKKSPMFTQVNSTLQWDGSAFEVTIDREKAADMNVPMQNITSTISMMLAGKNIGHFEYEGNLYNVILQMDRSSQSNPNIISELYVRNNIGNMVPLSGLINLKEKTSPESLPHYNRLRSDTIHAQLASGYKMADGVAAIQKIAKQTLPDNAKYTFEGEAKTYLDSNNKMAMTFIFALLFIYLILVAQFESFIDPLVILLTVPFALIGAIIVLRMLGGTLNIYSGIALVTLIGLIAKHGILITEFANRNVASGLSIEKAVKEAAVLRLRPILMTTAAMILGALPLALATGAGSETRHQVGWVIVGGLIVGTFFSLIVVPVAYTYFANIKIKLNALFFEKQTDQ